MLGAEEEAFAHGAFTFGDRRAREILVPRHRVVILTTGQPLREAARQAACSGHRRLPLCEPEGGLDRPEGVINLSDLTRALAEERQPDLFELARPLLETSEATLLDKLLEELRERREHMALVRDEHGTALGILTMEDILEQVVGDIRDEFDPPREPPIEGSGDEFTVAGELSAHAVTRELGLELGDYQEGTIGGYVIERLGVVSVTGDEVEVGGLPTR